MGKTNILLYKTDQWRTLHVNEYLKERRIKTEGMNNDARTELVFGDLRMTGDFADFLLKKTEGQELKDANLSEDIAYRHAKEVYNEFVFEPLSAIEKPQKNEVNEWFRYFDRLLKRCEHVEIVIMFCYELAFMDLADSSTIKFWLHRWYFGT